MGGLPISLRSNPVPCPSAGMRSGAEDGTGSVYHSPTPGGWLTSVFYPPGDAMPKCPLRSQVLGTQEWTKGILRVPELCPGRTSGPLASGPHSLQPKGQEDLFPLPPPPWLCALGVGMERVLTLCSWGQEASLLCPRAAPAHRYPGQEGGEQDSTTVRTVLCPQRTVGWGLGRGRLVTLSPSVPFY